MNTSPRTLSAGSISEAISALGFTPPQRIIAGRWSDFSTNGKRNDDAGRCLLFADGRGGVIWDHRLSEQWLWFADAGQKLTPDEQRQRNQTAEAAIKSANAAEDLKREAAAGKAKRVLAAGKPAGGDHPYLVRKQVNPAGLFEIDATDLFRLIGYQPQAKGSPLAGRILVAPVTVGDALSTLEFICESGKKAALAGGKKSGGFWTPEPMPDVDFVHVFAIAEGVATARSVADLTGWRVVAALSSGNLLAVAKSVRARFPAAQILIVADTGNGEQAARQAAADVGASLVVPVLPAGAGTDFNDLAAVDRDQAKRQLLVALGPAPTHPEPDCRNALVNPVHLSGVAPEDRQWVVEEWLPKGCVTLFSGPGGTGKSLIAQQLQVSTAIGSQFLGLSVNKCKSLAFYCEDDNNELHRRIRSICFSHDTTLEKLGDVRWQGRFGMPNVLATFDRDGLLQPTKLFDFILESMKTTGAELIILDNIAQLFGGNENDRSQVTQFVNKLGEIAVKFNAAVLLLAHPSKSDTGLSAQYSGSTAWDAAVRCRWMLARPKPDADQDASRLSNMRVLTKGKANYSTIGDEIILRWDRGAFSAEGAKNFKDIVDRIDEKNQDNDDDDRFLMCLDILADQNKAASDSRNSSNFAPKIMIHLAPWSSIFKSRQRVQSAMDRLFNAGIILSNIEIRPGAKRHRPMIGIGRRPPTGATDRQQVPTGVP